MQRSIDLVGQERELEHVHRAPARLEVFLEASAFKPALARRPQGGDPTLQPARDAQGVSVLARDISQRRKSLARTLMQLTEEPFNLCSQGGVGLCDALGHRQAQVPVVALVEKHLDAAALLARTDTPSQTPPRAFDVFASAEPVGPVIRALARVDVLPDAADLYRVEISVGGCHRVVTEGAGFFVHGPDFGNLGSAAPLPPLDFFLVRRMPTLKGGGGCPVSTPCSSVCTFPRHGAYPPNMQSLSARARRHQA